MTVAGILPQTRDGRAEFVRWSLAAAIVLAVHLGIIAGAWLLRPAEPQAGEDVPAITIELAPLSVAPTIQRQDLPLGPELQPPEPDAAEPPPRPELREPPKTELDLAPAPDPAVTLPQPKPAEESKAPAAPQQQQMAPPKAEQKAPAPVAPRAGTNSADMVPPSWIRQLLAQLNRHKQYPPAARARREEGVVTLSFTMDRDGHVLARHVAISSGSHALDAEALAMLARSEPLPAFPAGMIGPSRSFNVPIRFSLR